MAAKIAGGASDKDARRLRRLLRNRVSAQQARERKKQYVTTLEDQVKTQASTIAGLEKRVDELTVQNTALRNLIQTMRSPAKRLSGAGAFDASSLPRPDAQRLAAVAAAAAGRAPPRRSMSGGSAQLRPEPQAANTGAGQRASPHHHSLSPNALQSQLQPAGKCMLPPDSQLHGGMGSGTYVAGQAIAAAPAGPYDVEDVAEAHAEMDPDGLYRSEPAVDASSGFGTAEGDMHAAIVDYHAHAHQLSEQALQPSEHVQQLASMRTRVQAAQHLDQANAATQDHALPDGFAHEQQHYAQLQQCSVVIAQLPPNYSRYNQQYSMQYNSGQYSNVGSTMDAAMVPSNQVANGHGYGCYMESYADMNGMQGVPHSAAMNGTLHVLDGDMGDAAVVPAL